MGGEGKGGEEGEGGKGRVGGEEGRGGEGRVRRGKGREVEGVGRGRGGERGGRGREPQEKFDKSSTGLHSSYDIVTVVAVAVADAAVHCAIIHFVPLR